MVPDTYVGENISLRRTKSNTLSQPEYEYVNFTEDVSHRVRCKSTKEYFTFLVIIKKEDKGYVARCPELKGCWSEGDSQKEVKKNIVEAIQLYLDIDFEPKIIIERM